MTALATPLCDRLGIDVPIVQAPVGSVSCPDLAGAVSSAGALGTLAITWRDPETTRDLLREIRKLTDRPVAVNLVLDEAARVYPTEDHLAVCLDEGIDLFSFSFGDATEYATRVHEAGGTVLWTVGSEREARAALSGGADVLVAQGREAGGHVQGEIGTMALVPAVVDAVGNADVPVVAAGGIGDGRGIAAALALGADGAWLGTRFVATEEAAAHTRYRDRLAAAAADETALTALFDKGWPGTPHRTLSTETVEQWIEAGRPESGDRPGENDVVATGPDGVGIERYDDDPPVPGTEGDVDAMALYAGESVGRVESVQSAADVVDDLVAETQTRLDSLSAAR